MRALPRLPLLLISALALLAVACSRAAEEPSAPPIADASPPPPRSDAGLIDSGGPTFDAAGPGCFTNPTTYLEIINACTDAQAVDKQVDLSPMSLADGGLSPLP